MPRQVYLAVFSNGSKPAHWAIYIPTTGQQQVGKTVHVTGNTATGFYLEFKRNHDPSEEGRHLIIPLGEANEQYITDTPGNPSRDTTARDRFETTALTVPPPGRSPNPFDPAARNCQNWLVEFVDALISNGYLPDSAASVLQGAPKLL